MVINRRRDKQNVVRPYSESLLSNKKEQTSHGWWSSVIEHGYANQRVAGLIPSQGTCLGCEPGPP